MEEENDNVNEFIHVLESIQNYPKCVRSSVIKGVKNEKNII